MRALGNPLLVLPRYWWDTATKRLSSPNAKNLHDLAITIDPEHTPTSFQEFQAHMIDRMCKELPPGMCLGDTATIPVNVTTFAQMKGFLIAVREVLQSGLRGETIYVTQQEASRRSSVCSQCKHNMLGICVSCNGLRIMSYVYLLNRKTPSDSSLGVCAPCGCLLTAKVWLPIDILERIHKKQGIDPQYPSNCWQCKEPK